MAGPPPGRRQGRGAVGRPRPPRPARAARRARSRHRRARRPLPRGRGRRRDDAPTWTGSRASRRGSPGSTSASGGSGDPSPVTAFGVVCSMRAALRRRSTATSSLAGRRCTSSGVGHVAAPLVDLLVGRGRACLGERRLRRSCRRGRRADTRSTSHVGRSTHARASSATSSRRARSVACSTTSPIPQLRCRVIVGAANNQLGERSVQRISSPSGTSCSCPTSSPARAGSSTSPRSSWATTAQRALEHAAGDRADHRARPRGPRATAASRRNVRPRISHAPASPRRAAGRRWNPATRPPGRTAPRSHPATRATRSRGAAAISACCRCGRGSSGRAGARR